MRKDVLKGIQVWNSGNDVISRLARTSKEPFLWGKHNTLSVRPFVRIQSQKNENYVGDEEGGEGEPGGVKDSGVPSGRFST